MIEGNRSAFDQGLIDFKRSVEITRDVRFQANLRLSRRSRASAYVVSFLSTYVIALSLIPNIIELQPYQSQILLGCSVVLSVFVIFTSLIDGSQNFYHHGELLHSCARKIATIHHALKLVDKSKGEDQALEQLKTLQKEYQAALDECPVNHDNVDFYREMANKPHLFPAQYKNYSVVIISGWNRLRIFFFENLWVMPHLGIVIAITAIVYFLVLHSATPRGPH